MKEVFYSAGIEQATDVIRVADMPDLCVGVLVDKEKFLASDVVSKMVQAFRDIYGHSAPVDASSWGEYLICGDCKSTRSIEAVYGDDAYKFLGELEKKSPQELCCGNQMEYYWDSEKLFQRMMKLFHEKVLRLALLHDENANVYGFEFGWQESLADSFDSGVSPLIQTPVSKNLYLQGFQHCGLTPHDEVMHLVEVGQTFPSRKGGSFFQLLGTFLNDAIPLELRSLPGITTTNKKVNAYSILKTSEWKDVVEEDTSGIVVLSGNIKKMASATSEKTMRGFYKFYRNQK